MDNVDDVVRYYDASRSAFVIWGGEQDQPMHFGYYDDGTSGHPASLLRMNERLAAAAGIDRDSRVLDAGCGVGGSALWMAETIGCEVVGITVVESQLAQAMARAAARGLDGKASFLKRRFEDTALPAGGFDVVWALESAVHAVDKAAFVAESHRLLRPGGRLIIAEYMLREQPPLTVGEHAAFADLLEGWAMPSLLTESEYREITAASGFASVEALDFTEAVRPSVERMHRFVLAARERTEQLLRGTDEDAAHAGHYIGCLSLARTLDAGLWSYKVLVAAKPAALA